ncbi:MAG: TVP38/TMEM64 family protein [Erysipelotrichales bacterium]|nr:TVP38/TMEM64 family protein [Erysipelotrichales bacterium]
MNILIGSISEVISNISSYTESFLNSIGIWGAIFSCLLITVESILPFLPVCVFITLVFYSFGSVLGFFISWIFTCLGCFLSFTLFRSKIKNWFERKFIKNKSGDKIKRLMKRIDNISLSSLAILVAIPFTPASVVNVAAGLSNMSSKKFMTAMLIGKVFMVYFWGYIGTTLLECLKHPVYLVRIAIMLILAYIISKIINKHFNLD